MIYNVANLLTGKLGDSEHHELENERIVLGDRSLINVAMDEEFSPINASLMGKGKNRPDEDEYSFDSALIIDEQNYLDRTEGLGQALLSAIPIAPLCKDDCLGICPICTVNRNIISCSCAKSSVDPRWAGLAGLIGQSAESSD